MATGVTQPNIPEIPGIETAEPYGTAATDPADYMNQRVLVIGKGNSAFETADNLVETAAVIHVAGPNSVRMAWRTHFVGHLRAVNNNFLDTYQLKSQNAVLDGYGQADRAQADGALPGDGQLRPRRRGHQGHPVRPGDRLHRLPLRRLDLRRRVPSGADDPGPVPGAHPRLRVGQRARPLLRRHADAVRATSSAAPAGSSTASATARARCTASWSSATTASPWPAASSRPTRRPWRRRCSNGSTAPRRCGSSSAAGRRHRPRRPGRRPLPGGGAGRHLRDGPPIGDAGHFAITLEYGPDHDKVDPFDITVGRIRQSDAARAHEGHYLHPVVRHHRRGAPAAVHHMTENLENDWTSPEVHLAPLRAFFARRPPRPA